MLDIQSQLWFSLLGRYLIGVTGTARISVDQFFFESISTTWIIHKRSIIRTIPFRTQFIFWPPPLMAAPATTCLETAHRILMRRGHSLCRSKIMQGSCTTTDRLIRVFNWCLIPVIDWQKNCQDWNFHRQEYPKELLSLCPYQSPIHRSIDLFFVLWSWERKTFRFKFN